MARPLRVDFDRALYHVTSRGNARENIFEEDGDRKRTDCSGGASLRRQSERGCRLSRPALRYGQPVGKQALIQETRPDPLCVHTGLPAKSDLRLVAARDPEDLNYWNVLNGLNSDVLR